MFDVEFAGATVPGKRATAEKEVRKHYAYAESGPLSVMEVSHVLG